MERDVSRRGVLRALAAGSAAVTAGTTAVAGRTTPIRGDWHQHGADAANTSRTGDRGPQYNQETRWRIRLPSTDSAPLVAEDTVLVLEVNGSGHRVHALHASTGTTRWRRSLPGLAVSGVLAADRQHVFTAAVIQPHVTALDRKSGERQWRTTLTADGSEPQLDVSGGFRTAPRVADGRLYLKSRSAGRNPASVVVLDAATGEVETDISGLFTHVAVGADSLVGARGSPSLDEHGLELIDLDGDEPRKTWTYETAGRPGQPTVGEELTFVGTSENQLHAVDADGETAWTAPTNDWAVSLALAEEVVLAKSGTALLAFDADTGEQLWFGAAGGTRPIVASGVVYVGRDNGFDGYDVATGERVTGYRNPRLGGRVTHLSVAGNALLATAPRGVVLAVQEEINLPVL
jgi:outer membrane protein assembly factor BamB